IRTTSVCGRCVRIRLSSQGGHCRDEGQSSLYNREFRCCQKCTVSHSSCNTDSDRPKARRCRHLPHPCQPSPYYRTPQRRLCSWKHNSCHSRKDRRKYEQCSEDKMVGSVRRQRTSRPIRGKGGCFRDSYREIASDTTDLREVPAGSLPAYASNYGYGIY